MILKTVLYNYLEAPLLGKSARMRRARSATKRNQEAQQNLPLSKPMSALSRKKPCLLLIGDTSSSDTCGENGIDNKGFGMNPEDAGDLDYANERIEQIQQSMINIYR